MSDRPRLDWMVPSREWQAFRQQVEDEFGSLDGYLGREAELAMKEYADSDGYAEVEKKVDRLVRAAGRTLEGFGKKTKSDLSDLETDRVTVRVAKDVKDEFKKAAADADDPYGVIFARALNTYRDGGRPARLERKIDRILDDAESLLSGMDESDSEGGLGKVERNTIKICQEFESEIMNEQLNSLIHDIAGRGPKASEPTLEKYRELVIDRKNLEPHPNNPDLWIPASVAKEMAPDGTPDVCRKPVEVLNQNERVKRIRLALGRRAAKRNSGKMRIRAADCRQDILDREVSKSSTLDLMDAAADSDGFRMDRSGQESVLKVDLEVVEQRNQELLAEIIEYRDADSDGIMSGTAETTVNDFTRDRDRSAVSSQLDTLTAATDGGQPTGD